MNCVVMSTVSMIFSRTSACQLYLAATVANLTLLANQIGVLSDSGDDPDRIITTAPIGGDHSVDHRFLPTWMLAWLRSPTLAIASRQSRQ